MLKGHKFKVWFTKKIDDFVDTDKVNLEDFVNSIEVNRFPRRFSKVVEAMIKGGYAAEFLKDYDDDHGIEMLTKMNQKFLNLGHFHKVKLLRAFVNPSVINQSNKEFKK